MVDDAEPRAVSVLGALDRASLGVVMPREMLLFDNSSLQVAPSTLGLAKLRDAELSLHNLADLRANQLAVTANLRSPSLPILETELARLAVAGSPCTVVSIATGGRDPAGLVALARSTGVHIVMGVGLSHKAAAAAVAAATASVVAAATAANGHEELPSAAELLANQMVLELTTGVAVPGEGGVCAGVIGEIGTQHTERSETHATLLQAAAIAQMRTGAPIWCVLAPPEANEAAPLPASDTEAAAAEAAAAEAAAAEAAAAVRLMCAHGADARRVVLSHAQHLLGAPEALRSTLRLGCTLCFDGLGNGWAVAGADSSTAPWAEPTSDGVVAREVAVLVREGFGGHGLGLGLPNPNPNPTSNHTIPSPTPSQVREGFGGQLLLSCGVSATLQLAVFGGGGFGHVLERVVLSPEP